MGIICPNINFNCHCFCIICDTIHCIFKPIFIILWFTVSIYQRYILICLLITIKLILSLRQGRLSDAVYALVILLLITCTLSKQIHIFYSVQKNCATLVWNLLSIKCIVMYHIFRCLDCFIRFIFKIICWKVFYDFCSWNNKSIK